MDLGFANDIIDILDYIGKKFGIVIDWSTDTVLPYLKDLGAKYIAYKIGLASMWIIVLSLFVLVCIIIIFFSKRYAKKNDISALNPDYISLWAIVISSVLMFFAIFFIVANIYTIIECKTFPEKVIYDYISTLYANMKNN